MSYIGYTDGKSRTINLRWKSKCRLPICHNLRLWNSWKFRKREGFSVKQLRAYCSVDCYRKHINFVEYGREERIRAFMDKQINKI